MNRSETLTKIAPALVAALAKIEGAAKAKVNPGFKSKYADLETVIDASKALLAEHELTLIQLPGTLANGVLTLETILLHSSGEYIAGDFGIALGKVDPQGVGSALTYARRYAQMAALNMPAVDDDGEAAHGRRQHEPATQRLIPAEAKRQNLHGQINAMIDACLNEAACDLFEARFEVLTASAPTNWLEPFKDRLESRRKEIAEERAKPTGAEAMDEAFRNTVGRPGSQPVAGRQSAEVVA